MKSPLFVAAGVLAGVGLLVWLQPSVPSESGSLEAEPAQASSLPAVTPRPVVAVADRGVGTAKVPDRFAGQSLSLTADTLGHWVGERDAPVELPGGVTITPRATRIQRDEEGEWLSMEGTVSQPAPGRFFFRRQPEGVLPGPMVGFVFYPGLDFGYRVETFGGQSRLVRRPVDDIACVNLAPPPEEAVAEEIPADHPTDAPIPGYQNGVISLQSLPGATGVVYLDFDGEEGPHESWGDFDAASFNRTNNQIFDVWVRVAEDFAAFNLNVTTDLQVYQNAPETSRIRCIITPTTDAAPGAGGVAYLNSFNWAGDVPCWAFIGGGKSSAEVISHEIGHTLSLSHDGRITPSEEYYRGHGSGETGWAPIMGVGYYENLTQWSKGEYLSANQFQDDLARITTTNNAVAYRVDDHGGTHAAASPIGFTSGGAVDDEGNIETDGDVDAFLFTTTTGGTVAVNVDHVALGPNVDLVAELYDEAGVLQQSSNPVDNLEANLNIAVGPGTYTIRVTNTGKGDPLGTGYTSYASLGQYTLSGSIPGAVLPDQFSIAESAATNDPVGTVTPREAHGGNPLVFSIASGNGAGAFQIDAATGEITVDDASALDYESLSQGWNEPALFELEVDIVDTVDANLNETIRVLISVVNVNEAPVMTGTSVTILEHTRIGRVLATLTANDPDQLDVVSYAITAGDPAGRFALNAAGELSIAADLAYTDQTAYSLTITATDVGGLNDSATVTVNLIDTVEGYVPGSVEHAFYRNISGTSVANLTADPDYPRCPDDIAVRDEIHSQDDGSNFGRVVRGYLIPPVDGNFTLWIAGNNNCDLLLSTDADPGNATVIAGFSGFTDYQDWDRYSGQESSSLSLVGGQAYYYEVRHKEGTGADHVSLAWEIRDGSNAVIVPREPISGLYLAPRAYNYCPTLADASGSVRSNTYPGALVHQFSASDLNPGDSHTYAITGGDPEGKFSIDPSTGAVTLADPSDLATTYALTVEATDDGTPALSDQAILSVSVTPAATVNATGPLHEIWDNISGTSLGNLTSSPLFPDRPDRLRELTDFNTGTNIANDYGARVRAYLTAPTTGSYTFYLTTDDNGSLLLSTDEDPGNATEIASVPGWAPTGNYTKFPEQTSAPVNLTGGQRYFIEAQVKEGGGGDHIVVAWTGPGIGAITTIPASALEPYDSNVAPDLAPLDPVVDVASGAAVGTSLATMTGSDSPFETLAYAILAGDEAGVFAMDPQSGEITVEDPSSLHAGPYVLTVGVQDSGHGGYFPLKDTTTTVTIHVDDADHDGLPDPWETDQFGVLTNSGTDDTDGDRYDNRTEFVFGSDGDLFSSWPQGPAANGVGAPGAYRFELMVHNNLGPGAYSLHVSGDLLTWDPLEESEFTIVNTVPVDATRDLLTVEVLFPGEPCFLKARAE